ncbi:PspC domain-containing protein [Demequina sp.]|uniref:PspC domain-containing protein n=1 Tax=Demequina sp. TaxID=2050685 RepID=UPI003D0F1263
MSAEPTQEAAFFSTIRSWGIVRADNKFLGGVLSGVGARIGMAPAPARIIYAVLAFFIGGPLLVLYAAAWALLPDSEGRIIIQDFGRGRPQVGSLVGIGIIGLIGIGLFGNIGWNRWWNLGVWDLRFGDVPGPSWMLGMFLFLIPAAIVAGIVWLIVWSVRYGRSDERAAQGFARRPDGSLPDASAAPAAPVAFAAMPAGAGATASTPAATPASPEPVAEAEVEDAPPVYAAPVYTAPPRPPRPRVPGPGKVGYLLALAMIPIAWAITLYLEATDQLAVFPTIAAFVIWVAGLGVILAITALRGRKLGFLGFVSVVALIPIGFIIGYADDIREARYEGSGLWWDWEETVSEEWGSDPEPIYTPPPPFDASAKFPDYATVAINGGCYATPEDYFYADVTGSVRLTDVAADQTITVTSYTTVLSIPRGTSLTIVNTGGMDGAAYANVSWRDRNVTCDLTSVGGPAAQLTNPDAPVLTVRLDDTETDGSMSLWIEEN